MSTDRSFQVKRAVLRVLADCRGYPVMEPAIQEATLIKVDFLRPTVAEIDAALRETETERLSIAITAERGRKYKITDAGTLWLAENA